MSRPLGVAELAVVVGILAFLAGGSLSFTHVQSRQRVPMRAGAGARTFIAIAAWVSSLGAMLGWGLVLAELAMGPIAPIHPWVLGVGFGLAAPPLGQMYRCLKPDEAERSIEGLDEG